jgi:hypothetical protein
MEGKTRDKPRGKWKSKAGVVDETTPSPLI